MIQRYTYRKNTSEKDVSIKQLGYINYGYNTEPGENSMFSVRKIALGSVVIILVLTGIALGVVFGLHPTTTSTTTILTTTTTPSPLIVRYLVLGGQGRILPGSLKTTEVFELTTSSSSRYTPSFGELPTGRVAAVGGVLGNTAIVCGDYDFDYCLSFENSQWKVSHNKIGKRAYPAGVQINTTTFWILGGQRLVKKWVYLNSTVFIHEGQANGVTGPTLPYAMSAACAVKLSEYAIFLIGGHNESVWIFNPQNGFSKTKGPSLTTNRKHQSCSTMRDGGKTVIVVAGGFVGQIYLDSVEIYDPIANTWSPGPPLPYKLYYSVMVESPDGKGVLLFGGERKITNRKKDNIIEDRILELRAGANSWTILDVTLQTARKKHTVIPIPNSMKWE